MSRAHHLQCQSRECAGSQGAAAASWCRGTAAQGTETGGAGGGGLGEQLGEQLVDGAGQQRAALQLQGCITFSCHCHTIPACLSLWQPPAGPARSRLLALTCGHVTMPVPRQRLHSDRKKAS